MTPPRLHVYNPQPTCYGAYVRRRGHKKWEAVGPLRKSRARAVSAAVNAIQEPGMDYKRARVLACFEWFEPSLIMEIVKP